MDTNLSVTQSNIRVKQIKSIKTAILYGRADKNQNKTKKPIFDKFISFGGIEMF